MSTNTVIAIVLILLILTLLGLSAWLIYLEIYPSTPSGSPSG